MSQTAITLAFEHWKAQQGVTGEPVLLDEFVFANVPRLNPDTPVDRNEALPPVEQIVHRQPVTRTGVVNENGVVYSAVLGADVGDFSFNWIGLLNKASGTLAMIVHAPVQQKLKTAEGQQGNVLTRSFLMEYNGAQTETGINTPAETWQIDFTARLSAMDERQRRENIDLYGAAAFFDSGYLVAKSGNQFFVTKGAGYVAGLRAELPADLNITASAKPTKVWLDVSWTGTLTSEWAVQSKITVAADLADYVLGGVQHYVFAVASIDAAGNITDLRPKGTLNDQAASDALKKHEQSRNHPDATTSAKGFTQLSSATDSASEEQAATPKAVKIAMDNASTRLAKDRNLADLPNPALARQNLQLGDSSTKNTGTTANTVAAGDDARITDAMQKSQNGGDIPDVAKFLQNIGLGEDAKLSGNLTVKGGVWDTAPGDTPERVWSPNNKPSLTTLGVLDATTTQKGIVELATHAEMAAGSSSSLVPSVAAVMSLFSKKDFGGNSYIRIPDCPGGLIIEWGYVANAPTFQTFVDITFPLAFPNNAQTVLVTRQFQTAATDAQANPTVRNVLPTGFQLNLGDAASVNGYWLAIGY